jgi:ABC-type glycerol-3-phosphate transport system substrate-binding protein
MKSPGKVVAIAAIACASAGLLAGCSGTSNSSDGGGKVTISVASLAPGSAKAAFAAFDDRVKAFEKANQNITVKPEQYQWTAATFTTQLAGGTLPVQFNVPFTDSQSLLQNGQIANITSEVKALPYGSKLNKSLMAVSTSSNGDIYGLPYDPYAMGLSYNRKIFTEAGLNPNDPPTTWAQVAQDAKTISQKLPGVAGYMQMTSDNTGGWELVTTTYSRGGRVEYRNSKGKTIVDTDNPATIAALQFLHNVRWNDNAAGSNFLLDWNGINQAFGAGQIAMFPSGSDVLTSLVQSDNVKPSEYGLTTLPITGSKAGALTGGNVEVVSPKATKAQQEAAVKWIDFYYMQPLFNKTQAIGNAKTLLASDQPVGVPSLPVFDKATYEQTLSWIKPQMNVPQSNVAPFNDKIFDQQVIPEPNIDTQQLYAALDPVVQAVLTDKTADIPALLKAVDVKMQPIITKDDTKE